MHEFGIAKSLVEGVVVEAEKNHAVSVTEVLVEIGELTFINHEQLSFAFNIISSEIPLLAGSKLVMEARSAEVSCSSCGYSGSLKRFDEPQTHIIIPVFACPSCDGKVDIIKGRECAIKNIKLNLEDRD